MPQTIDVTGVGLLEFPDDMSDEEISKAIQSNFPVETPDKSVGQTVKENATQIGVGGTKGFFDLGKQFNAVGEAFFNLPTPVQRALDPAGPLRDAIGNLVVGEKNLASPFMRDQFGGAADLAGRWSREQENLGASLPGSKTVRDLSAAGTSLIPSLAAGPLGLPAMSAIAGLQSFGGQFKDTQEFFENQGLTKEEASKGAIAPALASGVVTGLITKAFGATGVEGILNAVKTGTFKNVLANVAKGTVLEGIEEGADQIGQSIVQKFSSNPNLTLEGAVGDVLKAAATGAFLGGGVTVATQTSAAIEKARKAGLNRSADELAKSPPPLPATPPPPTTQEIKVTEEEATSAQTTVLESGVLPPPLPTQESPVGDQAPAPSSTLSQPVNVAPTPTGEVKTAPVEYVGEQDSLEGKPTIPLYNLTEAIPGHPKGSTVAGPTLTKQGYTLPDKPVTPPPLPREGMGGASPSEFIPPNQGPTSNKNRVVDEERVERGLPPVMATIRKSWGEAWNYAMSRMDRNPNLQDELIGQLKKKPRPLKDWENVIVLQRRADLRNEYEKAIREGIKYFEAGDPERTADAEMKAQMWSEKLDELEEISKKVGSESGRSLAARKIIMNEDYSLASLTGKLREAKGFQPLTKEETADVVKVADSIKIAQAEVDLIEAPTETGAVKPITAEQKARLRDLKFRLKNLKQNMADKIADQKVKSSPLGKKVFSSTKETLNTARAFITSFEFSALLRQGKFIAAAHPIRAAKSVPAMFKAFGSEKGQFDIEQDIIERPNYPLYEQSGLFLADHGQKLSKMEEAYMSRWAERIPYLGRGIAASQRAYTTFLNKLRADSFDAMAASLARKKDPSPAEAEAISNFVNVATGRGSLGGGKLEQAAVGLNTIFFAPRYVASRFQIAMGQPLTKGTLRTKVLIAKEYGRFLAGMGLVYAMALIGLDDAELETDSRSSDFGKIKIGNTRIDPMAGLLQVTTLSSRLATGKTKTLKGRVQSIRGKIPYGGKDTFDVTTDFLRTKVNPVVGTIIDIGVGTDVAGKEVTAGSLAQRNLVPISYQDMLQTMEEQGVPKGVALQILSIFGEGVSTYEENRDRR